MIVIQFTVLGIIGWIEDDLMFANLTVGTSGKLINDSYTLH